MSFSLKFLLMFGFASAQFIHALPRNQRSLPDQLTNSRGLVFEGDQFQRFVLQEERNGLAATLGSKIALQSLSEREQCLLSNLPPNYVWVAPGELDSIGLLLRIANIPYSNVDTIAGKPRKALQGLQQCSTLFINSGAPLLGSMWRSRDLRKIERRLRRFVRNGGVLATTDTAASLFTANGSVFAPAALRVTTKPAHSGQAQSHMIDVRKGKGRCSVESGLDKMTRVISLFVLQGRTPRWHLRPGVSEMLRIRNRGSERSLRPLNHVLRFKHVSNKHNSFLSCGDLVNGSFFHVVGPLAQVSASRGRHGTDNVGTPINELGMNILLDNVLRSFFTDEERALLRNKSRELRRQGFPITDESVASSALSSDILFRLILKSWLPNCNRVVPECEPTQHAQPSSQTNVHPTTPSQTDAHAQIPSESNTHALTQPETEALVETDQPSDPTENVETSG